MLHQEYLYPDQIFLMLIQIFLIIYVTLTLDILITTLIVL